MLTIGSLFSGIGGLELGLERAGLGPVLWQVEQDPYCRKVLAKHWPNARRYEDVRTVTSAELAPVDILCGGFPCQDISNARVAEGAGLDGARSGLWFEYLRLIRELQPSVVVVENVEGLVRRGLDVVVGGLAGAGFQVEGSIVSAGDVGAPQRRKRIFLVAYADRHRGEHHHGGSGEVGGPATEAQDRDAALGRRSTSTQPMADADGRRCVAGEGHRAQGGSVRGALPESAAPPGGRATKPGMGGGPNGLSRWLDLTRWPAPPGDVRYAYRRPGEPTWIEPPRTVARGSVPKRRQRIKALGNAVVPQVAYVVGMRVRQVLDP